jgi:hypothetical protein
MGRARITGERDEKSDTGLMRPTGALDPKLGSPVCPSHQPSGGSVDEMSRSGLFEWPLFPGDVRVGPEPGASVGVTVDLLSLVSRYDETVQGTSVSSGASERQTVRR